MKAKKYAIRGLITLAAVVAICMFFAGTIRSIATAKVKIVTPKQGKLTQSVELTSKLYFPVSDDVYLEGAKDVSIDINAVKVEVGYEVKEGDELFQAEVADFDKTMASLRGTYDEAETALQTVLDKDVRLKRTEEAWADAYEALADAKDKNLDASLAYRAGLKIEGLQAGKDGALPDGASDALSQLYTAMQDAKTTLSTAQAAMTQAERYAMSDETRTYITDKIKYERQLADTEQQMLDLTVLNSTLKSVVAKADGYITELNVKVGEAFNPANAAYAICPKDEDIVLRADTTNVTLNIAKNMDAYMTDKNGNEVDSEVGNVGVTLTGGKYADIKLKHDAIKAMGGVYALASGDVNVKIVYKAKQATTLLPSAAVRGSGEERFVYTLRSEQSSFGTVKTVTVKTPVTVIAESDGTVSVEEDLSYQQVAYMEDRSISEGDSVMEYSD